LILDNFGIIGFLFFDRIPVDSSHFSLHFDSILSPKIFYFERFKAQFNPSVRTNCADSLEEGPTAFKPSRTFSTFPLSSGKTLNLN
jgi:hypothetical protein